MSQQPYIPSREYLKTTGRALARWWMDREGAHFGPRAEAYRAWWKRIYSELADDVFAPSDVYEQLQVYAAEARQAWEEDPRNGPPPPVFADLPTVAQAVRGTAFPATALLVAVALVILLARR